MSLPRVVQDRRERRGFYYWTMFRAPEGFGERVALELATRLLKGYRDLRLTSIMSAGTFIRVSDNREETIVEISVDVLDISETITVEISAYAPDEKTINSIIEVINSVISDVEREASK